MLFVCFGGMRGVVGSASVCFAGVCAGGWLLLVVVVLVLGLLILARMVCSVAALSRWLGLL